MSNTQADAYVLLEDGARFDGIACGADAPTVGEIIFTTAMAGYQEAVTDPSYAGQLLTFTYPEIGNYGVSAKAMESDRAHARGVIMRTAVGRDDAPSAEQGWLDWLRDQGVPAITDVDTRALVLHIREQGAMKGGIFPSSLSEDEAQSLIAAEPSMSGRNLAETVSPAAPVPLDGAAAEAIGADLAAAEVAIQLDGAVKIAMIDTGVKRSILRNFIRRGAQITLYPAASTAEALLADDPDAIFLANGPGDPAALDDICETIRGVIGVKPVYGICLGHQLLSRAVGLETYKLPFGHHGANHPVKDLATGRTEITSQNHGFAVLGPGGARTIDGDDPVRWKTDYGEAQLSHINLYDRTVEGLTLLDVPGATVQYHPEAGPGPHDSLYLFDRFLDEIRKGR